MAFHHVLLSLLLVFAVISTCSAALGVSFYGGETSPIPNPGTNKEVQDLCSFAVAEYNRENTDAPTLTFIQALQADSLTVSGTTYYLKLSARYPDGHSATFYAAVFEATIADGGAKKLVSFTTAEEAD